MRSANINKTILKLTGAVGLYLLVLAAPSFCTLFPDPVVITRIGEIQADLYNDRYDQAKIACDSLALANEGNPFPLLIWSGVLLTEMKEKEANLFQDELFKLLDTAAQQANVLLQSDDSSVKAWAYLALGHAWAYRSLWEARFGSGTQAYRQGKQAKEYYTEGLKYDSTLYDLYAGLGEYNYWKSTEAGFLRSIGLIRNERDEGVRQLWLAADSSVMSRASAKRGLIWIYLNKERYDSSIVLAEQLHRQFPQGRAFVWALAQAWYAKEEYSRALKYLKLMRSRIKAPPENYHKMILVDHLTAQCYLKMDDKSSARQVGFRFQVYSDSISDDVRSSQKKLINFLDDLAHLD